MGVWCCQLWQDNLLCVSYTKLCSRACSVVTCAWVSPFIWACLHLDHEDPVLGFVLTKQWVKIWNQVAWFNSVILALRHLRQDLDYLVRSRPVWPLVSEVNKINKTNSGIPGVWRITGQHPSQPPHSPLHMALGGYVGWMLGKPNASHLRTVSFQYRYKEKFSYSYENLCRRT